MLPEIKIKMPTLSSLPSLPSLQGSKKHLLKRLQLSDVIVAMVEQQMSVDKTKQLKTYLTRNRKRTIYLVQEESLLKSIMHDLPDFARKQWGFTQLLKFHIQKKRENPSEDILIYEKKLAEVQNQFSNSLQKYKHELQQGKLSLEQIKQKVDSLYQTANVTKKYIRQTNVRIRQQNKKIITNIRRQQNISKTIAMVKVWNKSKISKVLSLNLNQIQKMDIKEIMMQFDYCLKQINLQVSTKQLQNFDKVLKVIEERRNLIVKRVQKDMLFSIIQFTQQKYVNIYQQYKDLLQSLAWNNQDKFKQYHQLQRHNLQIMVQDNIDHLYWQGLESVSRVNNIELLGEQAYFRFFQKLVDSYNSYILKWHKATSFHVNSETQYKDNFIKMLQTVADKIIKKVFHLIKYSQKFFSLPFQIKVQIILQIDRLVDFLQEWTSKKDISLFQVLREKFRTQVENFRKQTNGFAKMLFVQEFSQEGLMPKIKRKLSGDQKQPRNLLSSHRINGTILQQKLQGTNIKQKQELKRTVNLKLFPKVNHNLRGSKQGEKQYSSVQSMEECRKFRQRMCELLNQTNDLQLSKVFKKSIVQYCQRQQILPFGHLEYILQHFQFLILLIFKVCVHQETKNKLIEDFSQRAFSKLREVENGIQKNPFDQVSISNLTKMRQSFIRRRNYLQLHHFLSQQVGSKFDNLVVSGFVNINKLYQNPQENRQLLNNYHIKLSKLIQQMLKISRWLISNQSYFSNFQQSTKKLECLPTVLIQLGLLYFQHYNHSLYQQYVETIEPLMKGLKWRVQKFNQETTQQFRQYKINILQIYTSSTLNIGIKDKELYEELTNKHLEVFYKALLYLYCKIDKINDNGRQVLRLDGIEIFKILQQVGYDPGSWAVWFQKFVETTMERSMKNILQTIQQLGIVYPINCWRSNLLWIVNNFSTKEKKQYMTHLLKIYVGELKRLPQL